MKESISENVVQAVIPGVDEVSTLRGAELATKEKYFRYTVGIHPVETGERNNPVDVDHLERLYIQAAEIAQPVAIGETGLDYFHAPTDELSKEKYIKKQHVGLQSHIWVAEKYRLPLIIHVRDKDEQAYTDLLSMLRAHTPDVPIILHCISGPLSYVEACVHFGAFISFAGNVTYPTAQKIREYIPIVPADKILIETDAPYLPPQSHRGQVCRPSYIRETADFLESLGVDLAQAFANAQTLFGIE